MLIKEKTFLQKMQKHSISAKNVEKITAFDENHGFHDLHVSMTIFIISTDNANRYCML